jgi:hypothetical protein
MRSFAFRIGENRRNRNLVAVTSVSLDTNLERN